MDDMFLFSEEDVQTVTASRPPWKVLVVDDEKDVHAVTTLALGSFEFQERELELHHAYSARQAKDILADEDDIALILLDVVMETDQAGLELAAYIRRELNNHSVRIVLRTGQPGQAPEHQVIRDYDINDYKNKTELTSAKLYTILYSNLRSYKDINAVIRSKAALERLIIASRGISSMHGLKSFVSLTLTQLKELLHISDDKVYGDESGAYAINNETGEFSRFLLHDSDELEEAISLETLEPSKRDLIEQSIAEQGNIYRDQNFVMFCKGQRASLIFYGKVGNRISSIDRNILNIFTENLISIIENIYLHEIIDSSQKEIIYRLGEVVESRSNETGYHVKRVAYYSALLAELVGLPEDEVELIKSASPLHDVGKIAIPDAVLNKPGRLEGEEWEIMKTHALKGYNVLNGAGLVLLDIAATIALTHHEKWDGSGYPRGLAKDEIHLYGRITAIADVFDALGSDRCYKKAWPLEKILNLFREERGKHFDPRLIDLMMDNLDRFLEIRDRYQD
ncbi:MAG: HD domain-containing phosphohydrolase [Psychrobium sp.]